MSDAADAEAVCKAVQRPSRRVVPVQCEEVRGAATVFRVRELLILRLAQAINALRGHRAEFGQGAPQRAANAARLIARKPPLLIRVALANSEQRGATGPSPARTAWIVWTLMAKGEDYRPAAVAA